MKSSRTVIVLSALVAVLSLVAAASGVFRQGSGSAFQFLTLRGETVLIQGRGLYAYDTVSVAAQAIAQDVVTLVVGIPLLVLAVVLYGRGSLRGNLLLSGTMGYFLYTYASYSFLAAYNSLFLLYVALFSLSLSAFVLSLMSIDVRSLPSRFSEKLPRTFIAILLFAIAAFLLLAWLGRIVPSLLTDAVPFGLESYSTLVIQVLDLGLVVPLALLSGILLLMGRPWGYLLTGVALIKGFTMALAVTAMVVGQLLAGVEVATFEVVVFPILALLVIVATILYLRNVEA